MSHEARIVQRDLQAEEDMHRAFDLWLPRHISPLLTPLPYDPELYPHQRIDIVDVQPIEPSIKVSQAYGRAVLGEHAFDQLVADIRAHSSNVAAVIPARVQARNNVLVATAHAKDVLDTALMHNALFCAMGDEAYAPYNGLVTNKLMSRLAIGQEPVTNVLARSGRVFIGIPPSDSAKTAGLDSVTLQRVNRPMGHALKEALENGIILHRAPADTVANEVPGENGSIKRLIPRVDESMINIIRKRLNYVVPVAMWLNLDPEETSRWKILSPEGIVKNNDVHMMMNTLAGAFSEISNVVVEYDAPLHMPKLAASLGSIAADKPASLT